MPLTARTHALGLAACPSPAIHRSPLAAQAAAGGNRCAITAASGVTEPRAPHMS